MFRWIKRNKDQRGFTLVELAIVTMVSGIMMVAVMKVFHRYTEEVKTEQTKERIKEVNNLIRMYKDVIGEYPCPARRVRARTHPDFGVEACDMFAQPGKRDTDGDGKEDGVLIGVVPITTIREELQREGAGLLVGNIPQITEDLMWDGWGGRFTYAVSQTLTEMDTYNVDRGVIAVVDEFGKSIGGVNDDAHYVVVSHGPNNRGAHSVDGRLIESCPTTNTITKVPGNVANNVSSGGQKGIDSSSLSKVSDDGASSGGNSSPGLPNFVTTGDGTIDPSVPSAKEYDEIENCDRDSTFVQAPGAYKGKDKTYDDYVVFQKIAYSDLWGSVVDPGNGVTGHITNLNADKVGVSTQAPDELLGVGDTSNGNGVLKVEINTLTDQICSRDGSNCFKVSSFTDNNDIQCDIAYAKVGDVVGTEGGTPGKQGPEFTEVIRRLKIEPATNKVRAECERIIFVKPKAGQLDCGQLDLDGDGVRETQRYIKKINNLGEITECTDEADHRAAEARIKAKYGL